VTGKQTSNTQTRKSFSSPDQHEQFDNGSLDLINLGEQTVGRIQLQRGWRYSESVQQMSSTPHVAYVTRGALHVKDDSGTETIAQPDDVVMIRDGYDAWCDEPTEIIDFANPRQFAGLIT
jgi:hypothetical protein